MRCPVSYSLAAYVLGSLTNRERDEVVAHLPGCAQCRDELAGMAGVVGLLRLARPGEASPPSPPTPGAVSTAPPVAVGPAAAGRRRRTLVAVPAAVLVIVLAGTGIMAGLLRGDNSPGRGVATSAAWTTTDPASGVFASARLEPQQWGTAVRLRLAHLPPRLECRLVATRVDGRRQAIGTWRSGYLGSITVPASTAWSPVDIVALEVVTKDGHRVVRLAPTLSRPSPAGLQRTT